MKVCGLDCDEICDKLSEIANKGVDFPLRNVASTRR